jgi:hypothetical protein
MWKNPLHIDDTWAVVTADEVHRPLEELERLLWRRVLGRLRKVTPEASVYVGFAVREEPAQELA